MGKQRTGKNEAPTGDAKKKGEQKQKSKKASTHVRGVTDLKNRSRRIRHELSFMLKKFDERAAKICEKRKITLERMLELGIGPKVNDHIERLFKLHDEPLGVFKLITPLKQEFARFGLKAA